MIIYLIIVMGLYTTGEIDHTDEIIEVDFYFDFYKHIDNKTDFYKAFSYAIAKTGSVYYRYHHDKGFDTF